MLLVLLSVEAPCAAAGTLSGPDANPVANRYVLHDRLHQWGLSPPFSPQPPRPCPLGALASCIHLASKGRIGSWLAFPWDHSSSLPHHQLNAASALPG